MRGAKPPAFASKVSGVIITAVWTAVIFKQRTAPLAKALVGAGGQAIGQVVGAFDDCAAVRFNGFAGALRVAELRNAFATSDANGFIARIAIYPAAQFTNGHWNLRLIMKRGCPGKNSQAGVRQSASSVE